MFELQYSIHKSSGNDLIQELRDLIEIEPHEVTWNSFIGSPVITRTAFTDDLYTTAIAPMLLDKPDHIFHQVLDLILNYINEDGIVLVSLSKTVP